MSDKRKLTDEELEKEFDDALREIIHNKDLAVRAISDATEKTVYMISFTIAFLCVIIGPGLVLANMAQILLDYSSTQMVLTPSFVINVIFIFLGLCLCSLSTRMLNRLRII